MNSENSSLERELEALKAQKEQLERMFRSHVCVLKDAKSNENKTTSAEQSSEARSPQPCSSEVVKSNDPSSPTSPVSDSVKA